jgi:hypothetical protein
VNGKSVTLTAGNGGYTVTVPKTTAMVLAPGAG